MLRVAAIQLRTSSCRSELFSRVESLVEEAVTKHRSQLVVLPESFTGIYGVEHFANNSEQWKAKDSGTKLMSTLASTFEIHIVGGVIEQHPINKKMFNTIAAFGKQGQEVARYRKMHLSQVSVGKDATSEGSILESGDALSWFDIAPERKENDNGNAGKDESESVGWRIGIASCFDLRFRELSDMLCKPPPHGVGSDVIVYPSSWLKSTGDLGHWEILLKARDLDGQCYVVGTSNAEDLNQETVAFGHTQVIDPAGRVLGICSDHTADEIVPAVLTKEKMIDVRRKMLPLERCRRPIIYQDALKQAQAIPYAMLRAPTGMA